MNEGSIQKELCILLCHHLRHKLPDVYEELCQYSKEHNLVPAGCSSIEEALNQRYTRFPEDQFLLFMRSLRPNDDFPSIFRRITPFRRVKELLPVSKIRAYSRQFCHKDAIYCIAMDPMSRFLATGSDDRIIKLWSLPDLHPIHQYIGHENVITNISINPLCTMMVSSSHDKTIRLWSLKNGQCISVLGGFTSDVIHYVVFSPVGSMIAAACEDGSVQLWTTLDAVNGKPPTHILKAPSKGAVRWVSFSPGGEFLSYSSEKAGIVIVPLKTLSEAIISANFAVVDTVTFSSMHYSTNGEVSPRLLSVSSEEGAAATWYLENSQWKRGQYFKNAASLGRRASKITKTAWDCQENMLVIARTTGVYVYNIMSGELVGHVAECAACNGCSTICAHPTEQRLFFIANKTGEVAIVNTQNGSIVSETSLPQNPVFVDAAWSTDGRWIFVTDTIGSITTFSTENLSLTEFSRDCFEGDRDTETGQRRFFDRTGALLNPQPPMLDIRSMDFGVQMLQAPVLQMAAAELHMVSRIMAGERIQAASTEAVSAVAAPPMHIRTNFVPLFNPHGTVPLSDGRSVQSAQDAEDDAVVSDLVVVSETEDWDLETKPAEDSQEEEWRPVKPMLCIGFPQPNRWEIWQQMIVCDDEMFIPQPGEEVVLVRDACDNFALSQLSAFDPTTVIRCVVYHVDSCGPDLINVELITPNQSAKIAVRGVRAVNPEQLVSIFRFNMISQLLQKIKNGSRVDYIITEQNYNIKMAHGKVDHIEDSLYHYNSIVLEDGEKISPYFLVSIDGENVKFPDPGRSTMPVSLQLLKSIKALQGEEAYAYFLVASTSPIFNTLPSPISLDLIIQRLESGYYRGVNSIKADLRGLEECVALCLVNDDAGRESARRVISNLRTTVDTLYKQYREMRKRRMEQAQQQQNQAQHT